MPNPNDPSTSKRHRGNRIHPPTLDECSTNELASLYYSHDEEQALRSETKNIVRALRATSNLPYPNQHSLDNDDNCCARGLEN